MKRGWLGEKTGSGFYKRVKGAGGESEILTLDWQKMEYRAAAEGEIRLDRSGKGDRRHARAAAHCWSRRRSRARPATKQTGFFGRASARCAFTPRAAFRKSRIQRRGRGPRHALGIRLGTGAVRDLGCDRRRADGEGARARRKADAAARREGARFAEEIVLRNGEGKHALFRSGIRRAHASQRACGNHDFEIAEGSHARGAGKFGREPDRPGRRRAVLRIPLQDERDRRRYHRDAAMRASRGWRRNSKPW